MPDRQIRFAAVNVGEAPPRLRTFHLKARTGCDKCKSRRIKCDESRPLCGPCRKKGFPCTHSSSSTSKPTAAKREHPSPPVVPSPPEGTKDNTSSSATFCFDTLQLRLFYQFLTHTLYTLMPTTECWKSAVPLAFEHDYLMHAILMIAAAHLSYLDPGNKEWKKAEVDHLSHATSRLREFLSTSDDARISEAACATCILLYSQTWTFCQKDAYSSEGLQVVGSLDIHISLGASLSRLIFNASSFANLANSTLFGYTFHSLPRLPLELFALEHGASLEKLELQFRAEYLTHWPLQQGNHESLNHYMNECLRLVPIFSVLRLRAGGVDIRSLDYNIVRYLTIWPFFLQQGFLNMIENNEQCTWLLFWHFYRAVESSIAGKYWWAQTRTSTTLDLLERQLLEAGIVPTNLLTE